MTRKLDYLDRKHAAIYLIKTRMRAKKLSLHSISRDDLMIAVGTLMEVEPRLVNRTAKELFYKKKIKR